MFRKEINTTTLIQYNTTENVIFLASIDQKISLSNAIIDNKSIPPFPDRICDIIFIIYLKGDISIYEEVGFPSSIAGSNTHGASLYEEVFEPGCAGETNQSKFIGYTELDTLRREESETYGYQGLLKESSENVDTQYEISNDNQDESYEKPKILRRDPGYTDLQQNRSINEDYSYQKLLKQDNGIFQRTTTESQLLN